MAKRRFSRLDGLSTLVGLLVFAVVSPASAQSFVAITDIHFNPYHNLNAQQFETLSQTRVERWGDFFRSLQQPSSAPGQDSNYTLMVSALDAAKSETPDPEFVLYMGDFMAHDWQASYDKLAAKSIAEDPQSYRDFTTRALKLIASEFESRFPDVPVIATLGNDDAFCGDYWIQNASPFNKVFGQVWFPLLEDSVKEVDFHESFQQFGAYSAELPGLNNQRAIVLNSVLWSASYCNDYFKPKNRGCCSCENLGPIPGRAQFQWLEEELNKAAQQKKKVWLVMHIPPGLDSYAEAKAGGQCLTAEMWRPEFTTRYLKLLEKYHSTLQIGMTGHTHMDDFRLTGSPGGPNLLHKIVPAVSPIFKNRPAFQVYQLNSERNGIENWQTFDLDSPREGEANEKGWSLEYDARSTYGLSELTSQSIQTLFEGAKTQLHSAPAQAFAQYYGVGGWTLTESELPIYLGALLHTTYAEFSRDLYLAKPGIAIQGQHQALMRRPSDAEKAGLGTSNFPK